MKKGEKTKKKKKGLFKRIAEKYRKGPRSVLLRGGAAGALVTVFVFCIWMGGSAQSGFGAFFDTLVCLAAAVIGISFFGAFNALFITIGRAVPKMFAGPIFESIGELFRKIPRISSSIIIGSFLFHFMFLKLYIWFHPRYVLIIGPMLILIQVLIGMMIAYFLRGLFSNARLVKKIFVIASAAILLFLDIYIFYSLASPGTDQYLVKEETFVPAHLEKLDAAGLIEPGRFKVKTAFYGAGTDIRRPEYGETVDIKTETVDASRIFKGYSGFSIDMRTWYWGFDITKLPINGRVWYPEGVRGPCPLVLIVHGNHNMADFSDPGYDYLGEHLAGKGYIFVSVDENFLNGGFPGDLSEIRPESCLRGWLMLKHLEAWRKFNETAGGLFYNKVDMERIALIGHSRGGEGVAHAAAMNRLGRLAEDANIELGQNFNIKTVIAIAPVDGQYRHSGKPLWLENLNYLTIQGGHDTDLAAFMGIRQYQRIELSDDNYWCGACVYIYRANHGQFNSSWGRYDYWIPLTWMLNLKPLMTAAEQEKAAKIFITGFLEATLNGRKEYLEIFRNHRVIFDMLPKTIYVNRFKDSTFWKVADFEEDIDPTTASIKDANLSGENLITWSEEELRLKYGNTQENTAVRLGWERGENTDKQTGLKEMPPVYSVTLPERFYEEADLKEDAVLVFDIADTGEEPEKFVPGSNKNEQANNENEREGQLTGKSNENKGEAGSNDDPLDITVELISSDGISARLPLSYFAPLHPPLKARIIIWKWIEDDYLASSSEPILETYEFPIRTFVEANPAFKPEKLKKINFIFDRSRKGMIYIDNLGFRLNE